LFCHYVYVRCAILPGKAVPEMTCIVLSGTLNPTHLLIHIGLPVK